jgi:hypothetical protein
MPPAPRTSSSFTSWGKQLTDNGPRHPVVVAQATDPLQADIWIDALRQAGIAATTFERGVGAALGGASAPGWSVYPVFVSRDDLGAARSVIADIDGAAVLAPVPGASGEQAGPRRALMAVASVVAVITVLALVIALLGA